MNSWFRLVALALGIAAAGPALAFNITVSSRAASFGGAGTVVSVAPGAGDTWQNTNPAINCTTGSTTNCVGDAVVVGTAVWLRANPAAGSAFANWVGCAATAANLTIDGTATAGNFCRVNTSAAKNVTAYFKPASYTLTIKPGAGSVLLTGQGAACADPAGCTYTVAAGAAVEVTATPPAGYEFGSWAGCTSATNVCTTALTGNKTISAYYKAAAFTVGVAVSGPGSVAGGAVDCPGVCTDTVAKGGNLTLTATPDTGATFVTWFGCPAPAGNVCNLTDVQSNKSVSAAFKDGGCVSCHQNPPSSHGPNVTVSTDCGSCHGSGFSSTSVAAGHNDGNGTLAASARATAVPVPSTALALEIVSVTWDTASTTNGLAVRFKVFDPANGNAPVARSALSANNPVMHVARLTVGQGGDATYKSYASTNRAGATYTPPGGSPTAPAVASANQDTSWTFANGAVVENAVGDYTYTFGTASVPFVVQEPSKLHTVAMYATRAVNGYNFRAAASKDSYPDGTAVDHDREVVSQDACDACHGELTLHGQRRGVKTCLVCHNPSTIDPETNNNVDMATMVHKIHNGHLLANDYTIVGYSQTYYNYNHILMAPSHSGYFEGGGTYSTAHDPGLSRECGICHDGATAADAANAYSKPSIRACGSCHDSVNFAAEHPALTTVKTDAQCSTCHTASENAKVHSRFYEPTFGVDFTDSAQVSPAVPAGGHVFEAKLVSVVNDGANIKWTVDFKLDGAAFDLKNMNATTRLATCAFMFAGPTTDYTTPATGGTAQSCTTLATWAATGVPGRFTYAAANWFNNKAAGYYTASFEIMIQRIFGDATNYVRKPFSANPNFLTVRSTGGAAATIAVVTDPVEQALRSRRAVVTFDKCNACHVDLGFHSNRGRKGPDYCATCHNPKLDNGGRARYLVADARQANTFDPAFGTDLVYLPESVSMNVFIHRIHMGKRLESISGANFDVAPRATGEVATATASKWVQKPGHIVYGATRSAFVGFTASTAPEFADFTEFAMPNTMNRCDQCHIADGADVTWGLPETAGLAPIERTLKVCTPNTADLSGWYAGANSDWCANASTSGPAAYDPDGAGSLTGKIVTPPMKGVCTSCHDSAATDAHADAFTANPMKANAIEFCATCHGAGTVLDSLNVHRPVP